MGKFCFYIDPALNPSSKVPANLLVIYPKVKIYNKMDYNSDIHALEVMKAAGFKVIIGTGTSNSLEGLVPWFTENPDIYFISLSSNVNLPALSKRTIHNIYRLPPPLTYIGPCFINTIKHYNSNKSNILIAKGDPASETLAQNVMDAGPDIIWTIYYITSYSDTDAILPLITLPDSINTVCIYTALQLNYFNTQIANYPNGVYICQLPSPPELGAQLAGRYYSPQYSPNNERKITSDLNNFGADDYLVRIRDGINMAKNIIKYKQKYIRTLDPNNKNITKWKNTWTGMSGYLYFDNIGDRSFIYYTVYIYKTEGWIPYFKYILLNNKPFWLEETKIKVSLPIGLLEHFNYRKKLGKICFLLTNTTLDKSVIESMKFMGYNYDIFYIDNKHIGFLYSLYNKGYRYFIGCNFSTDLVRLKPFFDQYQDTLLISQYSSARSLNFRTNLNIYRLLPSDDQSFEYYYDFMINYSSYNYIVQSNDVYSQELYDGVSSLLPGTVYYVTSNSDFAQIVKDCSSPNSVTLICASDTIIEGLVITNIDPDQGIFMSGGGNLPNTAPPNFYYLSGTPQNERNVQTLINNLGTMASQSLYDAINITEKIRKHGSLNSCIGTNSYTYFDIVGDTIGAFFQLFNYYNGWNINKIYLYEKEKVFKSQ